MTELNKTYDVDPDDLNPTIDEDPEDIDETMTDPAHRRRGIEEDPTPDLIRVVTRGVQDVFTLETESGKKGRTLQKEESSDK